jgi:uncharacterized protein YbjT (DUF2867 family)
MDGDSSILVVGATGSVGGTAARALAARGHPVVALARGGRAHPKSAELSVAGVRIFDGDLWRTETLARAVQGMHTVICSATSMPAALDDGLRRTDLAGTLDLIEAAEAAGVARILYVSYSDNIRMDSPLHRAKRSCETRLLASRMQCVILRPSFFMQCWLSPLVGFDPDGGSARIYGTGESKISYISSTDVAGFAVAIASGNFADKAAVLELGGPEPLSQLDAIRIFEERRGKRISVQKVPVEALQDQYRSTDPLQQTFAALMLAYAGGDVVADAAQTAARYHIDLRSVAEYAAP